MTEIRPRPSYATTVTVEGDSQYVSANSYLQGDSTRDHEQDGDVDGESEDSMWTARSHRPQRYQYQYQWDNNDTSSRESSRVEILSTPKPNEREQRQRPNFNSNPSTSSSSCSSGSEVDMSGPINSPFFIPPAILKENNRPHSYLAPIAPRPNSPLPPLPPPKSSSSTTSPSSRSRQQQQQHLRGPTNTTSLNSNAPFRAPALTEHNSLASFQAAHHNNCSEDSHRTSSEVDLDISFDYDPTSNREEDGLRANQTFSDESLNSTPSSSSSGCSNDAGREGRGGVGGNSSLERLESEVMTGGWVGIEMSPTLPSSLNRTSQTLEHGIPQGQFVRSESGKLVGGARHSKVKSALDLRAQFKAAAEFEQRQLQEEDRVAIVVMDGREKFSVEMREEEDLTMSIERRNEIREGKRPVEGLRAGWDSRHEYHERQVRTQRRRSAGFGFGFAYNTTESLNALPRPPPHSAPLASEPVFANRQREKSINHQQQQPQHQVVVDLSPFSAELDQAKRTRAFPLPLRLNPKRSSLTMAATQTSTTTANSIVSSSPAKLGARNSRQSLLYYDSDVASPEPSPLFDDRGDHTDDDDDEGSRGGGMTNRTAPSTPNDTPLFQDCFDEEEITPPPLPDKDQPGTLAGLGFDFDISDVSASASSPREMEMEMEREEFPVVPLRRRSLPPPPIPSTVTTRRISNSTNRHVQIPSLSISPPPRKHNKDHSSPLEDILETDSSRSSQDSSLDPTVSPSRRISRRLSSSNPGIAGIGSSSNNRSQSTAAAVVVRRQSFTNNAGQTSTPTNERGATVVTPQHLLVTPSVSSSNDSQRPNLSSSPSFSFSPAPLRLVKAQLLRAAGYRYDHIPTSSPPLGSDPASFEPSIPQHATSSPRKKPATPQPPQLSLNEKALPSLNSTASSQAGRARLSKKRNRVGVTFEELSDLLSSTAESWIDEVIPAKLAFIAGFLLGPWCWIIGGWYLRPQDGELPQSRGTRCRTATCNCGRILRNSSSIKHNTTTTTSGGRKGRGQEAERERGEDDWAGLDKWVFGNRVAACGGGVGIAVLVGVAIWAAASA